MISLGIDMGSVGTKAVLYDGDNIDCYLTPTGWSPSDAGSQALKVLLDRNGLSREKIDKIITTGYGRKSLAFADKVVTEITCHARGASFLVSEARTVLDIGGQDSKVISLDDNGHVVDFSMNDKCAAGTGRFLQVMATLLDMDIAELGSVPDDIEATKISSMCTVFAESEIISYLAQGVDKYSIARGILESIATRAIAMLTRMRPLKSLVFTGGVSRCSSLVSILEKRLEVPVMTFPKSQFAGALGAALTGYSMGGK